MTSNSTFQADWTTSGGRPRSRRTIMPRVAMTTEYDVTTKGAGQAWHGADVSDDVTDVTDVVTTEGTDNEPPGGPSVVGIVVGVIIAVLVIVVVIVLVFVLVRRRKRQRKKKNIPKIENPQYTGASLQRTQRATLDTALHTVPSTRSDNRQSSTNTPNGNKKKGPPAPPPIYRPPAGNVDTSKRKAPSPPQNQLELFEKDSMAGSRENVEMSPMSVLNTNTTYREPEVDEHSASHTRPLLASDRSSGIASSPHRRSDANPESPSRPNSSGSATKDSPHKQSGTKGGTAGSPQKHGGSKGGGTTGSPQKHGGSKGGGTTGSPQRHSTSSSSSDDEHPDMSNTKTALIDKPTSRSMQSLDEYDRTKNPFFAT